jgi:hypothetical protein
VPKENEPKSETNATSVLRLKAADKKFPVEYAASALHQITNF